MPVLQGSRIAVLWRFTCRVQPRRAEQLHVLELDLSESLGGISLLRFRTQQTWNRRISVQVVVGDAGNTAPVPVSTGAGAGSASHESRRPEVSATCGGLETDAVFLDQDTWTAIDSLDPVDLTDNRGIGV